MTIKLYIFAICLFCLDCCYAQSFESEKNSISNYLRRMFSDAPFEGVKVLDGSNSTEAFLISVVRLNENDYPSEQAMNRVAEVKARSQASRYFNGANITSEMIIVITEDSTEKTVNSIERIRETSFGNVETLELLSVFSSDESNNMKVFIYYSPLNESKPCKKSKRKSTRR